MARPRSKLRILIPLIISTFLLLTVAEPEQEQQGSTTELSINPKGSNGKIDTDMTLHQVKPHRIRTGRFHAREFLIAHNKVRLHFREPPFVWDKGLAHYARRFAAKRAKDCKMIHSFGPYGENIFWGGLNHWTPTDVVRSWVREHRFYNRAANGCTQGRLCGHYTQIVWKESVRLGCARVQCNNGGIFAICSYDPPGNYINENPFTGPPPRPQTPYWRP
ncbi:hypothetical protein HHK36_018294 [Tetracentron sinense]|uniref:SCP domain-containing protein n=1 Tax=Tetracentron sinense TaxID=13715 RepID=A0A834YVN0_TETSI|nr:hypothetical protein HHK36_018294 [Tetracentron sinense]